VAKRIKLNIDESCCAADMSAALPITQGVPFADGELTRGAPVRVVDDEGRPVPTQSTCLATWHSDLQYVKWLLVDFQVDARLREAGNVFLEYGDGVTPELPSRPVTVEAQETILISTGSVELELARGDPDFFKSLRVHSDRGWTELLGSKPGPFLYITDGRGIRYNSYRTAPAPRIVIEDQGPMRASVCIKGYHASEDFRLFCPYILRIHAYAGRSDIRIFHTFIFDQDPGRFELSRIGMKLPLELGDKVGMAFGGQEKHHGAKLWDTAELVQKCDNEYEAVLDGKTFARGGRSGGWAYCTGSGGSVAVGLRDMWREFPKAIALDADGIDIQLLPSGVNKPLNLENPWKGAVIRGKDEEELLARLAEDATAGVCFKGFLGTADLPDSSAEGNEQSMREAMAFADKHLHDRRVSWGDTEGNGANGGAGMGKTHELWIDFRAQAHVEDNVEAWASAINQPPLAPAEPSYMCNTGALRILAPKDTEAFPEVEQGLELMFDKLWAEPVKKCRLYGMIDYGDLPNGHLRNDGVIYRLFQEEPGFKITDLIGWFNNEGLDMCYAQWQYFARTGQRKYWALAEANSEHVEDVDTIHAHPTNEYCVGLGHYHNMFHWSGGPSPSHTQLHGWLLHYFFTGNRRALDVAREVADHHVRNREPSGVVSNRSAPLRREFTVPVAALWAFYETTWEEKYGDCARRSLDFFLKTQKDSGQFPNDLYTDGELGDRPRVSEDEDPGGGGNECYMFYDAYRITNDPAIKRAVLGVADWILKTNYLMTNMQTGVGGASHMSVPSGFVAHAYQLTGEQRYASALREALKQFPDVARRYAEMKGRVCFRAPVAAHQFIASALIVGVGEQE